MAGAALKHRHLGRHSAHRQSLLRNLVTSLLRHEAITTTWPKAKETQRLAEKLITLAKKNTNATRLRASQILYSPLEHLPFLFTTLRERYASRPGGYTRVLRTEARNRNHDQAPTAILELVDGPRDMRFAMTARTVARERAETGAVRDVTVWNIGKVTRFRPGGEEALEREVRRVETGKGLVGLRTEEVRERERERARRDGTDTDKKLEVGEGAGWRGEWRMMGKKKVFRRLSNESDVD